MKMSTASRRLLWLGALLILTVNGIILAGVAWNRSAEDSRLQLTERELRMPYPWGLEREKSALALQLSWRVASNQEHDDSPDPPYQRQARWLDAAKLRELGFDVGDTVPSDWQQRWHEPGPRAVWLVLEFDGATHAAALDHARNVYQLLEEMADPASDLLREELEMRVKMARQNWLDERDTRSRLFVIDAGIDARALRSRYPDPHRHLITRGLVAVGIDHDSLPATPRYAGVVRSITIDRIHVPVRFHPTILTPASDRGEPPERRYQIELVHGRRHQPWVESVEPR